MPQAEIRKLALSRATHTHAQMTHTNISTAQWLKALSMKSGFLGLNYESTTYCVTLDKLHSLTRPVSSSIMWS